MDNIKKEPVEQDRFEVDVYEEEAKLYVRPSALQLYKIGKNPIRNNDEFEDRIDLILRCVPKGEYITLESLALCCGISTKNFVSICDGEKPYRWVNEQSKLIASRALELCKTIDSQNVMTGKSNPVPYIFRAKNYYGMSDKTEQRITVEDRAKLIPIEQILEDIPDDE